VEFSFLNDKALGPIQPPIHWVQGFLLGGQTDQVMKLTIHLHLVPSLRMRGDIHPLNMTSSFCGA